MNDIGSTIKYYRELKHLTQKELADKLSISPSTIGMYEQNRRTPDISTLVTMSAIFGISVGFLVGTEKTTGTNYSNFYIDDNTFDFRERIRSIMSEDKISDEEFAIRTGFDKQKTDDFLYASVRPNVEDLIKISGALNVSIDYLLDMSQRKRLSPEDELLLSTISSREKNLLYSYRKLNLDNQDILIGELKKLLKEQRYEESVAADEPLEKTGTDNQGK